MDPIPDRRWRAEDLMSSGVGQQISIRAQKDWPSGSTASNGR
jgi:hypothetical protein